MQLNDILKRSMAARKKLLEESKAPLQGPYYWIPKKDGRWDIEVWSERDQDDQTHINIWPEVLAYLAHEFNVPTLKLKRLGMHYTALPRGRVSKTVDGSYAILHGDNAPINNGLDGVVNAFNLRVLDRMGKVKKVVDHHEKIDMDDLIALKNVLGTDFKLKGEQVDMADFGDFEY